MYSLKTFLWLYYLLSWGLQPSKYWPVLLAIPTAGVRVSLLSKRIKAGEPPYALPSRCLRQFSILLPTGNSLLAGPPRPSTGAHCKTSSPSDLASCMMCCTALGTLLRPRMSAIVRARSLGRRWVLRACGRALFRDLAEQYRAGVVNFEYPGPDAQHWDACRKLGLHVAGTGPRQVKASVCVKAFFDEFRDLSNTRGFSYMNISCFLNLCMLAEARGYSRVMGSLEIVWDRAVLGLRKKHPGSKIDLPFREFLNFGFRDFSFQPLKGWNGPRKFLPGASPWIALDQVGLGSYGHLGYGLIQAAVTLLAPELLSTMVFIILVHGMHGQRTSFAGVALMYTRLFGRLLNLRLP